MLKKRNYLKKAAAVVSASALILSGVSPVLAADTYADLEKKAIASLGEGLGETLEMGAQQAGDTGSRAKVDYTLRVEDAGRSMLGMLSSTDLSWLKDIMLTMNVEVKDGVEAVDADLLLNGEYLTKLSMFIDFMTFEEYFAFPDFSDSYLKVSMDSEEAGDMPKGVMQWLGEYAEDPYAMLPENAEAAELVKKYGDMIVDGMQEGPSVEETVSVEGIGEDCTVYEGQIYQADAVEILKNVLNAAKEDETLKKLLESGAEAAGTEDIYGEFTSGIESLLSDLEGAQTDEESADSYMASRIWVNSEGNIVGRQLCSCEGVESQPLITWKNPSNGDQSALLLEFGTDDSSTITLTGTGTTAGSIMSGEYELLMDSVPFVNVKMEDFDLDAAKTGYPAGRFTLGFAAGDGESAEENILASFSLIVDIISDKDAGTCSFEIALASSGVPLVTLIISGSKGEGVEVPDLSALGTVYDMTSESDMDSYLGELNWNSLLDNAGKAGVPEELVSQLDTMIQDAISGETEEITE